MLDKIRTFIYPDCFVCFPIICDPELSVASTTAVTEPYPPPFVRSSQTYGLKHLLGSRLSDCRQYAAGSMQDQS